MAIKLPNDLAPWISIGIAAILLSACVTSPDPTVDGTPEPVPPRKVFKGTLNYPTTEIFVSENLTIQHRAMPVDRGRESTAPVLGRESATAYSTYSWTDGRGKTLQTVPSILSLPSAADGEFQSYLRENQSTEILVSATGRTFLIEEDRTTALPVYAHIIVQEDAEGSWKWFQLLLPSVRPEHDFGGYGTNPAIAGMDDEQVWLRASGIVWTQSLIGESNGSTLKVEAPAKAQRQ